MRQAAASPRWARTWGNCPVAGAHRDRATSQRNSQIELDVGGLEPTFGLPACQHLGTPRFRSWTSLQQGINFLLSAWGPLREFPDHSFEGFGWIH